MLPVAGEGEVFHWVWTFLEPYQLAIAVGLALVVLECVLEVILAFWSPRHDSSGSGGSSSGGYTFSGRFYGTLRPFDDDDGDGG